MAGRIIVGVDGSPAAAAALGWAATEARLRGAMLRVVHVVRWNNNGAEFITPTAEQLLEWGHKLVDDLLAATGVSAEQLVVPGDASEELVHQSQEADLLVVGTRGHNPLAGLLLGSVSDHCVRHARCPVVVARADEQHLPSEAAMSPVAVGDSA